MSTTKIGESTTKILKLLFFIINLHFDISNQIFTYRKLNLPLTRSGYFVFLPLEMKKKTRTDQSILRVPLLYLKGNDTQTFKSGSCKNVFSSVSKILYRVPKDILYNIFEYLWISLFCFDKYFLFHVITGRYCFSWKFIVALRFFKRQVAACFHWSQCFERSPYFMRYHRNRKTKVPK